MSPRRTGFLFVLAAGLSLAAALTTVDRSSALTNSTLLEDSFTGVFQVQNPPYVSCAGNSFTRIVNLLAGAGTDSYGFSCQHNVGSGISFYSRVRFDQTGGASLQPTTLFRFHSFTTGADIVFDTSTLGTVQDFPVLVSGPSTVSDSIGVEIQFDPTQTAGQYDLVLTHVVGCP